MNRASAWRLDLAKQIAPVYAANPSVRAIAVAGSVARGWADDFSDVELDVFWSRPPTDDERRDAVERVGGQLVEFWDFADEEWEESYELDGVKVEVSHYLGGTIEQFIREVVAQLDTAGHKQLRLAALQIAIPLHGEDLLRRWRDRIAYPDELARRRVQEQIAFGGWNMVELLVERGDWLLAYDLTVMVQKQVVAVLLALNRTFMAHPRGKWLKRELKTLRLKPPRLAERMTYALCAHSREGVREMHRVIEETYALVEQHMPEVDLSGAKRDARYRRKPVEGPVDLHTRSKRNDDSSR